MTESANKSQVQLTEFQFAMAAKFLRWCLGRGEGMTCSVEGKSETFIVAKGPTARVCIYSDGFDVRNSHFDIRFEPDDITSLQHAQEALVEALDKASQ